MLFTKTNQLLVGSSEHPSCARQPQMVKAASTSCGQHHVRDSNFHPEHISLQSMHYIRLDSDAAQLVGRNPKVGRAAVLMELWRHDPRKSMAPPVEEH